MNLKDLTYNQISLKLRKLKKRAEKYFLTDDEIVFVKELALERRHRSMKRKLAREITNVT